MVISGNGTYPLVIFGSSTVRDINVTSSSTFTSSNIGYKVNSILYVALCYFKIVYINMYVFFPLY